MFSDRLTLYLILAWLVASLGAGAVLALLVRNQIDSSLSFKKNWLYFSGLLFVLGAVVFRVALH